MNVSRHGKYHPTKPRIRVYRNGENSWRVCCINYQQVNRKLNIVYERNFEDVEEHLKRLKDLPFCELEYYRDTHRKGQCRRRKDESLLYIHKVKTGGTGFKIVRKGEYYGCFASLDEAIRERNLLEKYDYDEDVVNDYYWGELNK